MAARGAEDVFAVRPREYWFPLALGTLVVLIGSLPYLYGYSHATDDTAFMGLVGRDPGGGNGYLMLARQAQEGYHLFENLASPERLPRTFFNLEWWVFGKFARWTGLSLIATFHVGRVLTVLAFALAAYYLAAQCVADRFWRRFALLWMMLGAGLGWIPWVASHVYAWLNPEAAAALPDRWNSGILFQGYRFSMPFDVAGATIPGYLINKPHFIRAGVCVAMAYAFLIRGARTGQWRYFIGSGIFAFLHAAIRPFGIPEMGLMYILLPFVLCLREARWDWRRTVQCAAAAAFLGPPALYYAYLAYTHALGSPGPDFPPPSPVSVLLWFGLPLMLSIFCVVGLARLRTLATSTIILGLWIVLATAIGYSYPLFRAGMEGTLYAFAMASALLAMAGPLNWLQQRWAARMVPAAAQRRLRWIAAVVLALSLPSSAIAGGYMITTLRDRPMPYYLSRDVLHGLAWLDKHGRAGDVVLSGFNVGQHVPRMSGLKAYLGHWMLTPRFWEKHGAFSQFLTEPDSARREAFLKDNGMDYLFWGPEERAGAALDPAAVPILDPVFREGNVSIFRVNSSQAAH